MPPWKLILELGTRWSGVISEWLELLNDMVAPKQHLIMPHAKLKTTHHKRNGLPQRPWIVLVTMILTYVEPADV
jgi:hypothetical protein